MKFWKDLKGLVQWISTQKMIVLGGDFNGHIGKKKKKKQDNM